MKRLAILLVVLALTAAACASGSGGEDTGATPTTTAAAESGDGSDTTAPTETTAAPAEETGSVLTVGLFQEPDNLNPFLAVQTASRIVRDLVIEGLVGADPDGNYVSELAEVPSVAEGTISEDGLTVTYNLLPGLTWSDGDPFTSRDVKFTWETVMDPANAVTTTTGYELIEAIETPDDTTVIVTYNELYSPALSLFSIPEAILPAHVLEGQSLADSDFNRTPEGTGPYMVTEWNSGQSIILDANPNYRIPDRPLIDRIVFKIIPDQNAGIAQMRTGDIDAFWNIDTAVVEQFEGMEGVTVQVTPSSNVEYLGLNLSAGSDPADPHFAFSDPNVRQALAMAIDRTPIIEELLFGLSEAATSPIGLGWASPEGLSNPEYDPEGAKALLEESGWVDSDGDDIREKDGETLTLEISTPSGQQVRELTEQVLQQQFKEVGIELVINNVPAATLFGNWAENGKLQRGDFDIVMDTWGPDLDPAGFLQILFRSSSIPEDPGGQGWNFFRLKNDTLDAAIDAGANTLDIEVRKAEYRTVVEEILAAGVYIPLYKRSKLDAFSAAVSGYAPNPWAEFTWNAADWTVDN